MAKIIKSTEARPDICQPYDRAVLVPFEPPSSEIAELDEAVEEEEIAPPVDPAAVLAEARAEAVRVVQEAYAEGYRRGVEAGQAEFAESVGQAAQALISAGQALVQARETFLGALEPQVASLAHAIAARILRREAQVNPELLQITVRAALGNLIEREQVTLHVNPQDLDVLKAQQVTLLEEFDGIEHLAIVPDPSVESGGCMADTASLHVDATLNAQLDRILNALME